MAGMRRFGRRLSVTESSMDLRNRETVAAASQLEWLTPDWPAPATVRALSTLRTGGVSGPPYASLNLGGHVGDDATAVERNRRALRDAAGLPAEPVWLEQVHGTCVRDLDSQVLAHSTGPADAAVTRQP